MHSGDAAESLAATLGHLVGRGRAPSIIRRLSLSVLLDAESVEHIGGR